MAARERSLKMRKFRFALCLASCSALALLLVPGAGPSYSATYSWQEIAGFPGEKVYAMHYDEVHDALYVAAGYDGIWRCDRPRTSPVWTKMQLPEAGCDIVPQALAYDSVRNVLYTGDWSG